MNSVRVTKNAEKSDAITATANKTNLDELIETLKGPKTISTVTKSSMDWSTYKEEEGLQDTLQAASKEG